jgi:hypothetical protein
MLVSSPQYTCFIDLKQCHTRARATFAMEVQQVLSTTQM